MPFIRAQSILRKIRELYLSHPQQLTDTEQIIASRICNCSICDYFWVRHLKGTPQRCPHCNNVAWDRPLINALSAAAAPRNVGAPTPKDTDPGPVPEREK